MRKHLFIFLAFVTTLTPTQAFFGEETLKDYLTSFIQWYDSDYFNDPIFQLQAALAPDADGNHHFSHITLAASNRAVLYAIFERYDYLEEGFRGHSKEELIALCSEAGNCTGEYFIDPEKGLIAQIAQWPETTPPYKEVVDFVEAQMPGYTKKDKAELLIANYYKDKEGYFLRTTIVCIKEYNNCDPTNTSLEFPFNYIITLVIPYHDQDLMREIDQEALFNIKPAEKESRKPDWVTPRTYRLPHKH